VLDSDEHSSLLRFGIDYACKKCFEAQTSRFCQQTMPFGGTEMTRFSVPRLRVDPPAAKVLDVRPAGRRPVLLRPDDDVTVRGLEPTADR
jgi:hypothetical protein